MSMSLNSSFTTYAKSLEGTDIKNYTSLSSRTLRSKAGSDNIVTGDSVKSDEAENGRTESVRNNSNTANSNAEKKVFKTNSEIFYNNYFNTSGNKSFEIDGVAFSSEEVNAVRSVVQNAVSPLLGGKLYYDYKDYAQMGIAESSVAKYAAENLTEEQAEVVNKSLSGYISNLLDSQEEWVNSECIIDDREGIGDTGEMNTYYAVRHVIPQWMQDKMDAAFASVGIYREHTNSSADSRNRGLIYCASNKELAGNVRSLFAGTDITDASQLTEAFKQYKGMLKAAYQAVGFGSTTNNILRDDTNSFTKQISNMKAVFSGINRNGVDRMI